MATVENLLDRAERTIRRSRAVDLWRPSDARVNAEELLGHLLRKEVSSDDLETELSDGTTKRYLKLVARRAAGEPVAMILGHTDFKGLKLLVRKGVFVPRTSSELLADEAIRRLRRRPGPRAVDLATGTGPVALAVAREVPKARVWGVDISVKSLALAKENARRLSLPNVAFLKSDMLISLPKSLRGKVDVFTLHPPYVAAAELATLPKEIKHFEPRESLTDRSHDGLGLVRRLASEAHDWLSNGGWVMVEVSPNLSRKVRGILQRHGYTDLKSKRDSLGATRVVTGRLVVR